VGFKNPWVLLVDADERVPQDLWAEIQRVTESAKPTDAMFLVRRRDYLLGRWIKRSSGYPTWFGRLVRPGLVRVERTINEEYHAEGGVGYLDLHLDHFPFNRGFADWIAKHNRYSSMEAELICSETLAPLEVTGLFSPDPLVRRKTQKRILYKIPGRPLWMFMALYIFRGGFLEGRAGFAFCCLRAWYEMLIELKVLELRRRRGAQTS
jgi:hypothetical protein